MDECNMSVNFFFTLIIEASIQGTPKVTMLPQNCSMSKVATTELRPSVSVPKTANST